MREIKFRAWDKKNKIMINAYLLWKNQTGCVLSGWENCHCDELSDYMQFTGLHDKNGKEIFEGDIISVKGHSFEDIFIAEVKYKRGGFWIDRDFVGNWKDYMLEVVGHIYANPELLEGK